MPRYADVVMEHFRHPRNVGRLDDPDAVGVGGHPRRPPFMVMHFRLRDGVVAEGRFQTFGCVPAIAAGSALTEMIAGRTIGECLALSEKDVDEALGGLPPERAYCAGLAISAMRDALERTARSSSEAGQASGETLKGS